MTVSVTLCGSNLESFRFPSISASISALIPAFMWITVPPAKSSAPSCISHPPPHTQWAIGMYIRVIHAMMNIIHEDVFILSTMDPDIIAAASPANTSWNTMNSISGIDPDSVAGVIPDSSRFVGIPIIPFSVVPNAIWYP